MGAHIVRASLTPSVLVETSRTSLADMRHDAVADKLAEKFSISSQRNPNYFRKEKILQREGIQKKKIDFF